MLFGGPYLTKKKPKKKLGLLMLGRFWPPVFYAWSFNVQT